MTDMTDDEIRKDRLFELKTARTATVTHFACVEGRLFAMDEFIVVATSEVDPEGIPEHQDYWRIENPDEREWVDRLERQIVARYWRNGIGTTKP